MKRPLHSILLCLIFLFSIQAQAAYWPCTDTVKYRIDNYHPSIFPSVQQAIIAQALSKWAPYFRVNFQQVSSGPARLVFRWDTSGFYGSAGQMTQLIRGDDINSSNPGLIKLNLTKSWSISSGSAPYHHLESVLLFGIGQAMGLPTRTFPGPVMYYNYQGVNNVLTLNDIHWSQFLQAKLAKCNPYWEYDQGNDGQHFTQTNANSTTLNNWSISNTDVYLSGNFTNDFGQELLMIKPGVQAVLANRYISSGLNQWTEIYTQNYPFGSHWWGNAQDQHVAGDFDGDGFDEILLANPNGQYKTFQYTNGYWQQIQAAVNGDIDNGDRLLSGDFNGDGVDELMQIKPSQGKHATMRYNSQTQNWDIINQGQSGSIYWWTLSPSDQYLTGDFNGDGRDELLALNPNGWHHTMYWTGSQWAFLEGDGSSTIAWWQIASSDKYAVVDVQNDGYDELVAINANNGWSHTMKFQNGQWQFMSGNDGDSAIGYWDISANDLIVPNVPRDGELMILNSSGWWKIVGY